MYPHIHSEGLAEVARNSNMLNLTYLTYYFLISLLTSS